MGRTSSVFILVACVIVCIGVKGCNGYFVETGNGDFVEVKGQSPNDVNGNTSPAQALSSLRRPVVYGQMPYPSYPQHQQQNLRQHPYRSQDPYQYKPQPQLQAKMWGQPPNGAQVRSQPQPQLISVVPMAPMPKAQAPVQFQVAQDQEQLQPAMSMLVSRVGRSYSPRSRTSDDEADDAYYTTNSNSNTYRDDQEYQEDDHEPVAERRKKKKKAKGDSFPRRIIKKTRNAISSTTKAVFGAPKYIYTRYKETYGFGKKKGKGQSWGWDKNDDDKGDGWGWDRKSYGDEDEYERKSGRRSAPEYGNNHYRSKYSSYRHPGTARTGSERLLSLASLNSWAG